LDSLTRFVDDGGKLADIRGISEEMEAEIIRCLGEV